MKHPLRFSFSALLRGGSPSSELWRCGYGLVLVLLLCCSTALRLAAKDFTLIIDAGHGGKDAGAVGLITNEKSINLRVALAFGRLVEQNCPDVRVIYTRKTDVFVPLQERAEIANRAKADLFISIHTNAVSANKNNVRGAETYTLGMHRAKENLEVAKRENGVITLESGYRDRYQNFDPRKSESYIIFEFMQDHNMQKSVDFARSIQQRYSAAGRQNKGVHQAGFLVLRATSMPSVLTELGFISHPEEEQFMASDTGVATLSRAIFDGFVAYRKRHSAVFTAPTPVPLAQSAPAEPIAPASSALAQPSPLPSESLSADSLALPQPTNGDGLPIYRADREEVLAANASTIVALADPAATEFDFDPFSSANAPLTAADRSRIDPVSAVVSPLPKLTLAPVKFKPYRPNAASAAKERPSQKSTTQDSATQPNPVTDQPSTVAAPSAKEKAKTEPSKKSKKAEHLADDREQATSLTEPTQTNQVNEKAGKASPTTEKTSGKAEKQSEKAEKATTKPTTATEAQRDKTEKINTKAEKASGKAEKQSEKAEKSTARPTNATETQHAKPEKASDKTEKTSTKAEKQSKKDEKTSTKPEKTNGKAEKQNEKTAAKPTEKVNIVFKVQVLSLAQKIAPTDARLKGRKDVTSYEADGSHKYTCGRAATLAEARKLLTELKPLFPEAFVVAFAGEKRIPINTAQEILQQQAAQ